MPGKDTAFAGRASAHVHVMQSSHWAHGSAGCRASSGRSGRGERHVGRSGANTGAAACMLDVCCTPLPIWWRGWKAGCFSRSEEHRWPLYLLWTWCTQATAKHMGGATGVSGAMLLAAAAAHTARLPAPPCAGRHAWHARHAVLAGKTLAPVRGIPSGLLQSTTQLSTQAGSAAPLSL